MFYLKFVIRRKYLLSGGFISYTMASSAPIATDAADKTLESLNFENLALQRLPIDSVTDNYVREVRNACFSKVQPTPVQKPKMLVYSASALRLLDLKEEELKRQDAAEYFSGNKLLPGAETAAHCYCGHQFGSFSGQLGDGATMYLGEIVNTKNERWEIQFKGAGKTPYSRTADGRKVLRSSLREFLCSEAMHNLGIPTTRAGTCVTSESTVIRDIHYDGHPILEKCTIITRIAQTFIRFGSFEICKATDRLTGRKGPSYGSPQIIGTLLDYVVDTFYPEIASTYSTQAEEKYFHFVNEVVRRTAVLVAEWMCVGWCHGVLNTDNMSIAGLTIDYGPFGFIDRFDPDHICNGSDNAGRYSYSNQPSICQWNCAKLGESIKDYLPLARSKEAVDKFEDLFKAHYTSKMRKKLGLFKEVESDSKLVEDFLQTMFDTGADFTNSFRHLHKFQFNKESELVEVLLGFCCGLDELKEFNKPKYPRETLVKLAQLIPDQEHILQFMGFSGSLIASELEKTQKFEQLKNLTNEDKRTRDRELWTNWVKQYAERVLIDYNETSNNNEEEYLTKRVNLMNSNNPRFILRNHIAQNAIEHAEKNDFVEARVLLKLLENPYTEEPIQNLLADFYKGQCVNWASKEAFYESKEMDDKARIVVT